MNVQVTSFLKGRSCVKVSIKVTLGVSLKFFVFANLESVGCEVYFPEKKIEKLILKPLKSLFFVSRHNLGRKMIDVLCQSRVKGIGCQLTAFTRDLLR